MKVSYYVNELEEVVVCKISDVAEAVLDDLAKNGYLPTTEDTYYHGLLKDSFTGKAKCSDDDKFDVEKGKRIAYKRAMAKMNKSKSKLCQAIMNAQSKHFTNFSNVLARLFQKYDRIAESSEKDCEAIITGTDTTTTKSKMVPEV